MEQHPLYRLYIDLNDKVTKIAAQNPSSSEGTSMDLSDIIVRLRDLESKKSLESDINALVTDVKLLKEENEKLKKELENFNKVDLLESRLYNLEIQPKVDLEPLNTRISILENNTYNDRLNLIENRISSVDQFSNNMTDLTYRVTEIEKRPDYENRINDLEKRPELSQRLSTLETIVNNFSNS